MTFDLLPGGDENRARTIGIMSANIEMHLDGTASFMPSRLSPPFSAARAAWKTGKASYDGGALNSIVSGEDEELITGLVEGHHRTRRGVYDLLYRALKACGLDQEGPQ